MLHDLHHLTVCKGILAEVNACVSGDSLSVLKMTELGPLDDFAREILRFAQNDSQAECHSERSEESRAALEVITSIYVLALVLCVSYIVVNIEHALR